MDQKKDKEKKKNKTENESISGVKIDQKKDKEKKKKKKNKTENESISGVKMDQKNDKEKKKKNITENESISGVKMDQKKDKEKKKNKTENESISGVKIDQKKDKEKKKKNKTENESISGVKMDQKKDTEKKKMNKTKGANSQDPEADMKKGSSKEELFVVSCENGGEGKTDNAERNGESFVGLTSDNAERKRKRREKDKKEKSEDVKSTEEERAFVKESAKEGKEEKNNQKVKKDDIKDIKVGEKDGEVSESCAANATEVRKKRKKEKRRSKGESVVESKDTYNENKCDEVDLSSKQQENVSQNVDDRPQLTKDDGSTKTNNEKKKKKKHKKKENAKEDLSAAQQEHVDNGTDTLKETQNDEVEPTNKRKKKKGQFGNGSDDQVNDANKGKKRKSSLVVNGSDNTSSNKSNKKVRFSDQNEVFPPDLVKGKRFTPEEDQIVKDAVFKYIEEKDLGDEGVDMILNCGKHRALRGCWKEIASSIPYRPYLAIYFRARILLMRSESRKWTQEEYDMIKEYQEKHGNKWKPLADELGKHAWHVKDTWRRIKLPNMNKGHWSQEEYQRLFDLVNTDLQLKISDEKKSKHGMLRDNICWTAISDELATRAQAMCCRKWYKQLTSPMVAEGAWADSDDYRLLSALYSLDATCMEDVEWDELIDNRSGEVCRKRWNQMVLHIGHHGNKSFAEQVEVLAERYCPHLLEAREIWDNKPRVP